MQAQIDALYQKVEDCKNDVHARLALGNRRMDTQDESLKDIIDKLDTILTLHNNFEGFFRVMGWIGKGAVWVAKVGAIAGAAWLVIKDHIKW